MSNLKAIVDWIEANGIAELQKVRDLVATEGDVVVKLIPGLAGVEGEALKVLDFLLKVGPTALQALVFVESLFPAKAA